MSLFNSDVSDDCDEGNDSDEIEGGRYIVSISMFNMGSYQRMKCCIKIRTTVKSVK